MGSHQSAKVSVRSDAGAALIGRSLDDAGLAPAGFVGRVELS